jgi:hypothetical protein
LFDEKDKLKEIYSSFSDKLTYDDFKKRLDLLKIDKWKFVRAVSLYQQSVKCSECNLNVGMILLSSCTDALQLVGGEGCAWKNFKKFYLDYCPQPLRTPPIKYLLEGKMPSTIAPFEKAIRYIYKKFRCLYVHEGKGRLDVVSEAKEEKAHGLSCYLGDVIKGEDDIYSIDLMKIYKWFEKVTIESLYAIILESTENFRPN